MAQLSGSGDIQGNIVTNYCDAIVSGSGDIYFSMQSKQTHAVINGSGGIILLGNGIMPYAEYASYSIICYKRFTTPMPDNTHSNILIKLRIFNN